MWKNRCQNKNHQTVRVINSLQSDALRGLLFAQPDVIDVFLIAEIIRIGLYSKTEVLPEIIHAFHELCPQRFYVIDMVFDIKRKISARLDQIFPEYEKLFSDTFGVTSMKLLFNSLTNTLCRFSYSRRSFVKSQSWQIRSRQSQSNSRIRRKFFRHCSRLLQFVSYPQAVHRTA